MGERESESRCENMKNRDRVKGMCERARDTRERECVCGVCVLARV